MDECYRGGLGLRVDKVGRGGGAYSVAVVLEYDAVLEAGAGVPRGDQRGDVIESVSDEEDGGFGFDVEIGRGALLSAEGPLRAGEELDDGEVADDGALGGVLGDERGELGEVVASEGGVAAADAEVGFGAVGWVDGAVGPGEEAEDRGGVAG